MSYSSIFKYLKVLKPAKARMLTSCLTYKAHTSCVFDPINDCFVLNDISPISLRKNLTFLSVNGMIVSECQLLQCQIKSVFP